MITQKEVETRVKRYQKISNAVTFSLFFVMVLLVNGFSQENAFQKNNCIPDGLDTLFAAYKSPDVSMEQLQIWYDYGREHHKKAKFGGNTEHYAKATPYFWKIVVNDRTGTFKVAYSKLVECYLGLNEPDSALIAVYHGLAKYPDYSILHYHGGVIQKTKGNVPCAIPHYEALVSSENLDAKTLKNYYQVLAQLYFEINDPNAIEAQQKVVSLDPSDGEASSLLARMMEAYGMDPLKALENAFLSDTTNINNARQLGLSAYDSGKYQLAIRAFKAVLKQDPQNIEAMSYLGRSYEALNRLQDALQIYKKILAIDSKHLNTLLAMASVYSRLNDFVTARSYVYRATAIDPNYGLAYMVLGEIYENAVNYCANNRKKDGYSYDDKLVFEKAREAYLLAAKKDPNVASAAQNRYKQLAPFIRTKADKHMAGNRETFRDDCYSWINQ
jgi:tetratricopeptide (TPR) repeat protein